MTVSAVQTNVPCEKDQAYQSQLENLAALSHAETNENLVVAALARAAMSVPGTNCTRVWLGNQPSDLFEAGSLGIVDPSHEAIRAADLREQSIFAVYAEKTQKSLVCDRSSHDSDTRDDPTPELWVFTPLKFREQIFGIHFASCSVPQIARAEFCRKMQALADAISPFIESRLTAMRADEKDFHARLFEFCREVHASPSLSTTTSALSHEYQRLFQADRVWILIRAGRNYRVRAVSGIPGFQRRAQVVHCLEQLAGRVCRSQSSFEWIAGKSLSRVAHIATSLDRYLDQVHVAQLRIEAIAGGTDGKASGMVSAAVVCEWFQPVKKAFQESQWGAARQLAGSALELAFDWSRAPLALWLRQWRRQVALKWSLVRLLIIAVIGWVVCACALLPMDFSIDAFGELQPVNQRHVFATSTGVVRDVLVESGDEIVAGTPLLELEDAELELEIRRVEGELQTTERRIATVEASRLHLGTVSQENLHQINTLAGEFSEKSQEKENLLRELELLELRRNQMKIVGPIDGQVVTWDLKRLLLRRPVTRGQQLMTIADTQGPWQLELRVADEDCHEVCDALRTNPNAKIEFIVVSNPGVVRSAQVRELSETVEIRSPGDKPSVLCIGHVTDGATGFNAAGLGVRGRIHCGTRAAIFVGFHKLSRAIQQHLLFPWGF